MYCIFPVDLFIRHRNQLSIDIKVNTALAPIHNFKLSERLPILLIRLLEIPTDIVVVSISFAESFAYTKMTSFPNSVLNFPCIFHLQYLLGDLLNKLSQTHLAYEKYLRPLKV